MFPIYIKAVGLKLHALASMLPESESPTILIFEGEAAVRVMVDRQERFGELVDQFSAKGLPRVEVCLDYESKN